MVGHAGEPRTRLEISEAIRGSLRTFLAEVTWCVCCKRPVDWLASEIGRANRRNRDWISDRVLRRYELGHRRTAWPIYAGTNFIFGLYGNRRQSAMPVRHLGFRLARRMPLFRSAVSGMLLRA